MCRLFGLVAPKSMAATAMYETFGRLSAANPDGWGVAQLRDGMVMVSKAAGPAAESSAYASLSSAPSQVHLAHLRAATFARSSVHNSHPFQDEGAALAHNGAFFDLPVIESMLSPARRAGLVGHTDSERYLALVGTLLDQGAPRDEAIMGAARMIGDSVPTYSLNALVASTDGVHALRYPHTNGLFMLRAPVDDALTGVRNLVDDHEPGVTVFASEPLDDLGGWQSVQPGELIYAGTDGRITRSMMDGPPTRQITRDQVDELGIQAMEALGAEGGRTLGNTAF